ncbi:MAG TPA: hypothetical protein VGH83_01360, partial [Candidatus Acidoferrum sp.]
MKPLFVDGRRIHQVGLPYHWGYQGNVKGDVVNDLLAISEEPNVRIMESKALLCNVERGHSQSAGDKHRKFAPARKNDAHLAQAEGR